MVDSTKKTFSKIYKVAIWIGLFLILFSMMAFVPADHSVLESRTVRIGVYQNKPKIFLDENGNADGFFIDLIKEIAKQEDWTLEFVPCEFEECLAALVDGQIDLMPDVAYSPQRDEIFDFHHIPAAESWSRVYTNPESKINRIDQLNGKKVAVLSGSIQQTVLKETMTGFGFEVEIVPVTSLEEAFTKAANGSADAAVANHFFGDYYYKTYGLVNTSIIFNASTLYYATRQGANHDLLDAIDEHLIVWRDDPNSIYTTILNHWLNPSSLNKWIKTAAWGIGISLALLGLAITWILSLRYQVQLRTQHLQAMNQEMQEREERYRLISTVASDYMFSNKVDEDGNIKINWVAGAFELITGYTIEEYVARGGWRATIHPDDLAIDDRDMEVLNANQPLITEIRTITKSGQTVWVRVYAHPIWDNTQNKLTGIYGAVQDITERKRIEAEIRQMNITLEQRVVERTKELENAKIRAEDADRIKSAFLATMSHELRTPLNSILGFTGILLMGLVGPLQPEQEKQLNMVQDSARHLLELINDVLDISKIEAGQIELIHESFDMQAAVQKSIEKMKPLAEKKGLTLSYTISPEVTSLEGDRRRVEQVMLNLLSNAIKFTEQGEVNLQCSIKNGQVVTSISDTGIGIKKEQMDSLFQPFKQLESGITRQHDGTGLGLSISRRLIEMLGGTIWVESEWGKGSCFTFSLPHKGISL